MKRYKSLFNEYEDYVGGHQAPTNDGYNAPLYDASRDIYPDDIYTDPMAWNYYGHGGDIRSIDKETINIIRAYKDKPNDTIEIYRAVPKGIKGINRGDWVTINKRYAKIHGESPLKGNYDIISKKVKAKELWTDGNSIHEWGYDK